MDNWKPQTLKITSIHPRDITKEKMITKDKCGRLTFCGCHSDAVSLILLSRTHREDGKVIGCDKDRNITHWFSLQAKTPQLREDYFNLFLINKSKHRVMWNGCCGQTMTLVSTIPSLSRIGPFHGI